VFYAGGALGGAISSQKIGSVDQNDLNVS